MMKYSYGTDISRFGNRELLLAAELLTVLANDGYPDDFSAEDVSIELNLHSGVVFLTNERCHVCILDYNDNKIKSWYLCCECGMEGFEDDIEWDAENQCCGECSKLLKEKVGK